MRSRLWGKQRGFLFGALFLCGSAAAAAAEAEGNIGDKVDALISTMTLEQKVAQIGRAHV